jgi:hypothetical protein
MLKGEIATLEHFHPPRGKTKGTRSTPYYSLKRTTLTILLYYNYSNSRYKIIQRGMRKVRVLSRNKPTLLEVI